METILLLILGIVFIYFLVSAQRENRRLHQTQRRIVEKIKDRNR